AHRSAASAGFGADSKYIAMQDRLASVDVLHETLYAAQKRKVFFLALTLVDQAYLYPIVQERQLAQALGQNIVVVFDVIEYLGVGQILHARTGFHRWSRSSQWRTALSAGELDFVHLTVTPDGQTQPFG